MFESIFLGCQDLSPSISEQILISLKLLLLLLQALCSGYKSALKTLLLDGILRHDKFFIAEDPFFLGERHVVVVLRIVVHGLFIGTGLPIFPFGLCKTWLGGVFVVFGIIRSIVLSRAGIAVFPRRGLEQRR